MTAKKQNRLRPHGINIRVTAAQYAFIKNQADELALKTSEWFEQACLKMVKMNLVEWRKL